MLSKKNNKIFVTVRWSIFIVFALACTCLSGEENFLLVDNKTNKIIHQSGPNVTVRFTPYSTFKIALSLMGYDSSILKDRETPVWPFQEGYVDYVDSWKSLQNPQTWIKNSCVWYSQVLATELGLEKLQNYLHLLDYGNKDMSGGLTKAWLGSSLKISPKEQVAFIQKIVSGNMPISTYALEITRSLLFIEDLTDGWKLFGKTGYGNDADLKIGWFVGWIEKEGKAYIFAYAIRNTTVDPALRIPRVKQLLEANVILKTE